MRPYRGLTKDGKWVEGSLVNIKNHRYFIVPVNTTLSPLNYDFECPDEFIEVIPETVGQSTGLPDKNGVEIYESDKITNGDKNIKYVVEWIDCGFRARQIGNKSSIGLEYWKDSIEVIGNIHQEVKI